MTTVVQSWAMTVTIDGDEVDVLSVRTSHGVDQPVGTATIETTRSVADTLAAPSAVVVQVALNGGTPFTVFTGTYRSPEKNCSTSGDVATLTCEGPSYRLTYPLEKDVVFTGGARTSPQNVQTAAMHIGNDDISWYADTTPNGLSVDKTVTPLTDSTFAWLAGRLHGTNSYPTSLDDKKIKKFSDIQMRQAGGKRGFANFPENSERYNEEDPTDFTDDENWSDFELMISGDINVADGDVTFRFGSGTKPGSGLRDEYEVKNVTWQTAGRNTVRDIIRGMLRRAGLSKSQYKIYSVVDLDGNIMRLGGNGLADAGQVRVVKTEQPISFIGRLADLFGYKVFDGADGIIWGIPVRGQPTATPTMTFTEGTNLFSIRRTYDPSSVYNAVRVEGWSGTDQDRKRVAYTSQTATVDIEPSDVIPDPPGVSMLRISDSFLISNALCADVRRIAEINHAEAAATVEWDSWPHNLRPGQVVTLNSPSVGFSGDLFLMSIQHDLSASGFRTQMQGWAGGSEPFDGDASLDDPDPDEDATLPSDPRPVDEWIAYRTLGVYGDA